MKKTSLLILMVCLSISVFGQAPPPPPPPPPGLPIDGGIFFLLLAGLFYGAKKLKD